MILSRRTTQRVVINPDSPDQVVVEVVRLDGGNVKLGFSAARDVIIMREELLPYREDERPVD